MSVSSLTIWVPPSGQFLRLLYGAPPQVSFFAYYIGDPLRSVSLLTIGAPPQFSFFAYYMGAPSDYFLRLLYRGPLGSSYLLTIWGPLGWVSSHSIWGPLRSVSSLTIWGPPSGQFLRLLYGGSPQVSCFDYYAGAPLDKLLCILYGGSILRSVSLLTRKEFP